MLVDLVTLLFGERAATDDEVVDLAAIVTVGRHCELEAEWVIRRHSVRGSTFDHVCRFVGKQRFHRRQRGGRRSFLSLPLFPGDAEPIVERALPRALRDAFQPRDALWRHRFAAFVAARDEREVVVERRELGT